MKFDYILTENLMARTAAQLNFELCKFNFNIYIIKNDRLINAKSIIGLLSGELSKGDKITIDTSENDENEINKLKQVLNEIGREA